MKQEPRTAMAITMPISPQKNSPMCSFCMGRISGTQNAKVLESGGGGQNVRLLSSRRLTGMPPSGLLNSSFRNRTKEFWGLSRLRQTYVTCSNEVVTQIQGRQHISFIRICVLAYRCETLGPCYRQPAGGSLTNLLVSHRDGGWKMDNGNFKTLSNLNKR